MSEEARSIWQDKDPDIDALNLMQRGSMAEHLGIEVTEFGADWLRASMPVTQATRQPFGRLHGGASVALAETVGSLAASLTLDPAKEVAVGIEINANHLRPARNGEVFATARPDSLGRSIQVWTIRIEDRDGTLICVSRLTIALIEAERA